MGSNSFGKIFRMTTFGESHGPFIGVVVDGCPAGLDLSVEDITKELRKRRPGKDAYVSPRKEKDEPRILSGLFEGKTTGAPIAILIENQDADSSKYDELKNVLRPGHANFTYLEKYGVFDHRGGGRSSGRETACRVAAGAIAKKLLAHENIEIKAHIKEIGGETNLSQERMNALILQAKEEGDSLGGIVEVQCQVPIGLGDPVYEKIESEIASAVLSIPATKGVEFGEGFESARMKGSLHNDSYEVKDGHIRPSTNHSGGILGGITTGEPLVFRVAFKPTSSIDKTQKSVDLDGKETTCKLPKGSRHDPCIAIRGVVVIEAMTALVLADRFLAQRLCRI